MKKNEFINYIKSEFIGMHFDELAKLLDFFEQSIDDRVEDGMSEEEAVASLGDLEEIKNEFYVSGTAPTVAQAPNIDMFEAKSVGFEEKYIFFNNANQNIVIKDLDNSIEIIPSNDDKIHIDYSETDFEYYVISNDESKIVLECKRVYNNEPNILGKMFKAFQQSLSTQSRTKLVLRLPLSYVGDIDIKSSNGKIQAENVKANCFYLSSSNGPINLKCIDAYDSISASSSNGKLMVENLRVKNKLSCSSSNGKLILNSISAEYINASTSNGKIEAKTVNALKDLHLSTSNSGIDVKDIWGGSSIVLSTSNAKVKGTIIGNEEDYSVKLSTSNGKKSLKNNMRDTGRYLKVSTSNSNINIAFAPE